MRPRWPDEERLNAREPGLSRGLRRPSSHIAGDAMTVRSPVAGLVAPVTVAQIELGDPPTVTHISVADADHGDARQALVLVRLHTQPVATIVVDAPGGMVDAESCAAAARAAVGTVPDANLGPGVPPPQQLVTTKAQSIGPGSQPETMPSRAPTPSVTVVVATRERTGALAACLDSLARLEYPDYEVVVVDNDPITDDTAKLIRHRAEPGVRYAREDRRGLAAAHNCGLQLAEGTIVAFTDDDVIVDRHWLTEVVRAFQADTDVACVTGLILPAELQTPAQILLEAHGNFTKGFEQRVLDLGVHRPADPLFPFNTGQLGSGANMSFDREILRKLGGFDPAIGAGTFARGGDDLAAFFAVIASGLRLVYQPSAIVWHHHRRDDDSLARQAYGYGVGLGAYLASALAHHPASVGRLLRSAPAGLAYAFRSTSPRNAYLQDIWPRHLKWLERRGLVFGPVAYGISRWRTRGAGRPNAARSPAE
jgi:GT2 family glycosyltransferase